MSRGVSASLDGVQYSVIFPLVKGVVCKPVRGDHSISITQNAVFLYEANVKGLRQTMLQVLLYGE